MLLLNSYYVKNITFGPLPISLLTHCLMSGSDIICNSPNSPLTDIVRFDSLFAVNLTITKKTSIRKRFLHS